MMKTTKKFCCLALAVLPIFLAFSAPACAELAKDMKPGTWTGKGGHRWIKFGNYTWRVLSVERHGKINWNRNCKGCEHSGYH